MKYIDNTKCTQINQNNMKYDKITQDNNKSKEIPK